jgi:hypothetical protein
MRSLMHYPTSSKDDNMHAMATALRPSEATIDIEFEGLTVSIAGDTKAEPVKKLLDGATGRISAGGTHERTHERTHSPVSQVVSRPSWVQAVRVKLP